MIENWMRLRTDRMLFLASLCLVAAAEMPAPPGWVVLGDYQNSYELRLDHENIHGGKTSAFLGCKGQSCPEHEMLVQTCRADAFRQKRVRLSAWVKSQDAGRVNIFLRVDGSFGEPIAIDAMRKRPAKGTFDWREQSIVVDVPQHAAILTFGIILETHGRAWVDDFAIGIVDKTVKTTDPPLPRSILNRADANWPSILASTPARATNLDFELPEPLTATP